MAKSRFDSRRIFMGTEGKYFQLYKFTQHNDGSIYCNFPEFSEVEWKCFEITNEKIYLRLEEPLKEDGKLSIHGSGMITYRSNADSKGHRIIIKGNKLLNAEKTEGGVRHLFTLFSTEPTSIPSSPANARKSDVSFDVYKFKPFAMIFFAIPIIPTTLKINISANFHVNDTNIPPENGMMVFELLHHYIFCFHYRTKNMDKWPKNSHISYSDGYYVPLFIGESQKGKEGKCRIELRKPAYKFEANTLSINLKAPILAQV